jgi:DNA-binding NtrC family response regulator
MSSKQRILIVDDEPDILEFLGFNLEMEGYEVQRANNGAEGLEKAKGFLPDFFATFLTAFLTTFLAAFSALSSFSAVDSASAIIDRNFLKSMI